MYILIIGEVYPAHDRSSILPFGWQSKTSCKTSVVLQKSGGTDSIPCLQKRKIRKKAAEPVEETLDIAALEAEAAAAEGGNDRGSRADKQSRDAKKAEAREAQLQERKDR